MLYPTMVPGHKADTGICGYRMTTRFRWPRLCSGSSQRRPPPIRDVSHQAGGPGFPVASGSGTTMSTSFAINPSSIGPADTSWEIPANGPKMPNIDPIATDSLKTILMHVGPKDVRADHPSGICILVHHVNPAATCSSVQRAVSESRNWRPLQNSVAGHWERNQTEGQVNIQPPST